MQGPEDISWAAPFLHDLPTPSYVYRKTALAEGARRLAGLLPANARLLFSLKANPQPAIAGLLDYAGISPEVASEGEYAACLLAGIATDRIVVGGVAKGTNFLRRACLDRVAAITVDSIGELERLRALGDATPPARVLLRVNPGIAIGGLDMGGDSQFGLSIEQAIDVVRRRDLGCHEFLGLHFYLGSQRLKVEPIVRSVALVRDVLRRFISERLVVPTVDVGLGCGVTYLERDSPLDYDALGAQLRDLWRDPAWRDTRVWSEAGRALVGHAGWFVCRVMERKELNGKIFVLTDGGLNVHNPGVGLGRFLKGNPKFRFLQASPTTAIETVDICGSLCTSADRLGNAVAAPRLAAGDLVMIPNAGAYCHTTALWGFNSQPSFREAMLDERGIFDWVDSQPVVATKCKVW